MKAFESTGFWWLPEYPDARVAGTLHVSNNGDPRLCLIGALGEKGEGEVSKTHGVIFGSVDNSPRGNEVSLRGCAQTRSCAGSYYGRREEYRASRAYFGWHLGTGDALKFRHVQIKIGSLSEWASSLSGLRNGEMRLPTSKDAGKLVPVAQYLVPEMPTGKIKDAKITLNFGVNTQSRAQAFKIREEANIAIEFDQPRELSDIDVRYIYPLQNLMTFSTDRPQAMESISVWRGEDRSDWENNPEIRVIGRQVQVEGETRGTVRSHEMLLTLGDVQFVKFVEQWLALAERYTDVFNIFFGIQYAPPAYIDMTYGLVAQCLSLYYARTREGSLHREEEGHRLRSVVRLLPGKEAEWVMGHLGVSPHPSFHAMLQRLIERHGAVLDPIIANRREAFINQASTTLRYINNREDAERGAAARGSDLYWLIQKLRLLLKACLLGELGFKHEQIIELANRNPYFQHLSMLEMRKSGTSLINKEINFSFEFVIPADSVLETASHMAESTDADEKLVGKSVLELTEVTRRTKSAVEGVVDDERFDLSVYLDFDMGNSLEAAKRLQDSVDERVHDVAETLLSQIDAIATSKTAFIAATKSK